MVGFTFLFSPSFTWNYPHEKSLNSILTESNLKNIHQKYPEFLAV